jgi:hypothetical protein
MKLVRLENHYFLLDAVMTRMAKDLPVGTQVFCLDETHMNNVDECLRKSASSDHCRGCQPLLASTMDIEGVGKLDRDEIESIVIKTEWEVKVDLSDANVKVDLSDANVKVDLSDANVKVTGLK